MARFYRSGCMSIVATALLTTGLTGPAGAQTTTTTGTTTATTVTPTPAPSATPAADKPLRAQAGTLAPNAGMIRAHDSDVSAMAGMIRAHLNDISPFGANSDRFWGATNPLATDLEPFWGRLQPYAGMIRAHEGSVTDMAGMIRAHQGDLGAMAGMIRAHLGELGATAGMIRAHDAALPDRSTDYAAALADYRVFVAKSEAFWATPVEKATGRTFADAFAAPMLAKHGIDLSDPASLAKLDAWEREMFFLEWHDGLMQYSGADQVDHWMKAANWTPKLTQQQGSGSRAVLGLVDFFVADDPDISAKVIYSGGYTAFTGHGAGVASLILASHDGKGVMGIAPNARVAAFNPFDETYSASWADVTRGIVAVTKAGASVVNLSLGVPGYTLHPEWRTVLKTSEIDKVKNSTLYVIAAGNSGTVQSGVVNMKDALDTTFLVVGSVAPDNSISSFSNQPGWTCLSDSDVCKNTQRAGVAVDGLVNTITGMLTDRFAKSDYLKESGLLMNRFLVAPGELILVADGLGGVTRMSGTSFSTPLVSGAIALLHDRWPWLKNYPRDVAKILLDSATDLGERGADPVYGRGLLNVEASQSVLDFSKLRYQLWSGTTKKDMSASTLRSTGFQAAWADNDMYFAAFEKLANTERDFLIPLSSRLFGTQKNGQYFQEFVYNHFVSWLGAPGGGTSTTTKFGFSDVQEVPSAAMGGWAVSMAGRLVNEARPGGGFYQPQLRSSVTVSAPSQQISFRFGTGDGAVSLGSPLGLQSSGDFDAQSGGVNPLLGFASGGGHLSSTVALGRSLALSVGATAQRRSRQRILDRILDPQDRLLVGQTPGYDASAMSVRIDYRPMRWLALGTSITRLDEARALLGVQSLVADDFGRGSSTDGVTVDAQVDVAGGIALFGSATGSRSASPDERAAFRIARGGVIGTAYQLGIAAGDLFGRDDRLRLSLSQPLHVESGRVDFTSIMVVDRETGEQGPVTQSFDLGRTVRRRLLGELRYAAPLADGRAQLSVFGRGEMKRAGGDVPTLMLVGQARFAM